MDQAFLDELERELEHLKSYAAGEYARKEKFADLLRLVGLDADGAAHDPFVDWLLEGYAVLATRVRMKLEEEFPRFTQNLLTVVHPHIVAPTPSMAVVEFRMKPAPVLMSGPRVERGRPLALPTNTPGRGRQRNRAVTFTTGREVRLWPLRIKNAAYLPDATAVEAAGASGPSLSGVSFDIELTVDNKFENMETDELDFFVTGDSGDGARLFEALALSQPDVEVAAIPGQRRRQMRVDPVGVIPLGLDRVTYDEDGSPREDWLLPYDNRSFDGYRLLHEFFALPQRFHFIRLKGLNRAFANRAERELRLIFRFNKTYERLSGRVGEANLRPNCAPVINLFHTEADEVQATKRKVEYLINPKGADPTGLEVHSVRSVTGRLETGDDQVFRPFFSIGEKAEKGGRFYAIHRRPRPFADDKWNRDEGTRGFKGYRGTDAYISLVDDAARPVSEDLRTLWIDLRCSNRHLPNYAEHAKQGALTLTAEEDDGWDEIRIVGGPSRPRPGLPEGRRLWDAVSHLSLNYLSLCDTDGGETAAAALKQIMELYAPQNDPDARALVGSLKQASARADVRRVNPPRIPGPTSPVAFLRGLEVSLDFEAKLDSTATLAAVLDRFLAGYVSVNNFTRTVMRDHNDGAAIERLSWPPRFGSKAAL